MSVSRVKIESSSFGSAYGYECSSWYWHPVSIQGLITRDVVIISGGTGSSLGYDKYFWKRFCNDAWAVSWDRWWQKSKPCALLAFPNDVPFKSLLPIFFLHISVVRAILLPWGTGFSVLLDLEQNDPLWSPVLPLFVQICAFFLHF